MGIQISLQSFVREANQQVFRNTLPQYEHNRTQSACKHAKERYLSHSIRALEEGLKTVECCLCSSAIRRLGGRAGDVWRHIGHNQRMHTRRTTLHGELIQRAEVSTHLHETRRSRLGDTRQPYSDRIIVATKTKTIIKFPKRDP